MFKRHRHVDDERLIDAYFTAPEVQASELATCPVCRDRYARLAQALDTSRTDALADADAAFPPERLAHQQEQILRRIDISSRPPRILRFPVSLRIAPTAERHARRWVAAAAAAGLLIGVLVGQLMHLASRLEAPRASARLGAPLAQPALVAAPTALQTQDATDADDDPFLVEVDAALVAPRARELRALDHFTPRVTEISLAGR